MNVEATIMRHLRDGYGVEDIEVVTNGAISADRARRLLLDLRGKRELPFLCRMWVQGRRA